MQAFESCQYWQFNSTTEQNNLNTTLMASFNKILVVTYGYDEEPDLYQKFTKVLANSSTLLTSHILSDSPQNLAVPIVAILTKTAPVSPVRSELFHRMASKELIAALELCTTALRVAIALELPTSSLEQQLFKSAGLLARLFVCSSILKPKVASLMDALLTASLRHSANPPSLLGHMGAEVAKNFLTTLTQVEHPLDDPSRDVAIWRLITTVVGSRQQWFALYLLTGREPRENRANSKAEKKACAGQPVFKHALNRLLNLENASQDQYLVIIAMLKFVSFSYNHWPWAVNALRENPSFITSMANYFAQLRREGKSVYCIALEGAIAKEIAEILTMHLHTSRQLGDISAALSLVTKLGYVKNYAFKPPEYRSSLHQLLKRNVADVYHGLKLSDFHHTLVFPVEYGDNFCYDVPLACRLFETVRYQRNKKFNNNIMMEFRTANLDLASVETQMQLHNKCKLLAIELAQAMPKDKENKLFDPLMDFLRDCIRDISSELLPQRIKAQVQESFVDLSLTLYQKILPIRDEGKMEELRGLFPQVLDMISTLVPDFETLYTTDQAPLNRKLVRLVFLSLHPLTAASQSSSNQKPKTLKISSDISQITNNIIIKGFKSLATLLHESADSVSPNDFALITAILQTILKIQHIDLLYPSLVLQLSNSEVARYASSLFSWSDKLLLDNNDPIYGEHAILFLLELSSLPAMAEALAVEGILSTLSSASIMAPFTRPGGMGPFDNPPRLHSIWSRGILPLCLNLLDAVGPPIAPEILVFLNQYPAQITRLVRSLAERRAPIGPRPLDSHLTLNMAAETHSLSLLALITDSYRAMGGNPTASVHMPVLAAWDRAAVKEDVEDFVAGRARLADRVVPANEREAELAGARPLDLAGKAVSRLEELVERELVGALRCLEMGAGNGGGNSNGNGNGNGNENGGDGGNANGNGNAPQSGS